MGERREFPRLKVALDATYRVEGSSLNSVATILNLSACGLALVADEPVQTGTVLERLHFTLGSGASSQEFSCRAQVLRCVRHDSNGERAFLLGLSYLDLGAAAQSRINDYVLEELGSDYQPVAPRIEIQRSVAVRYDRFDEFVTEVSRDLSRTGMFLRSEEPHKPGTQFDFVIQLGEDFKMVQGRAEVVWKRDRSESETRPAGMGIRFVEMDSVSENVLTRLIDHHTGPGYPSAVPPSSDGDRASDELETA